MCQLSIVNLNDKKLNEIADYFLSYSSSKQHNNGFGIMQNGRFLKTDLPPIRITNFGSWIGDVVTSSSPVYSHIRQASYGVEVCTENSHPFESDNFLLMHNGTLTRAKEKRSYVQGRESDSKQFLEALEETYKNEKDFVKVFNQTMSNWWGKFAFLIYHKKEKQHYVIRGSTAQLHKVDLLEQEGSNVVTGFIVNTEKDNLDMVCLVLRNMYQILYKKDLFFSDITALEVNTIYRQDGNSLVKLDSTKENDEKDFGSKEVVAISIAPDHGWAWGGRSSKSVDNNEMDLNESNKRVDDKSPLYKIASYQIRNWFTPKDIALIYNLYMGGKHIIQATEQELDYFADKVLNRLTPKGGISTLRFLRNELKGYKSIPILLYTNYGLEYPWVLNPQKDVIGAVRKYNKDMENARNGKLN